MKKPLILALFLVACSGYENLPKRPNGDQSLSCQGDYKSCLEHPRTEYCDICMTTCDKGSQEFKQCEVYKACREDEKPLCDCTRDACMPGGLVCDQCKRHCGEHCVVPG